MGKKWVNPSFTEILQKHSAGYRSSSDLGGSKDRTELIDSVAKEIEALCQEKGWITQDSLSTHPVSFFIVFNDM